MKKHRATTILSLLTVLCGTLFAMPALCLPDRTMSCCAQVETTCTMDEGCCHCGTTPKNDSSVQAKAGLTNVSELAVLRTEHSLAYWDRSIPAWRPASDNARTVKPTKLFILYRALLI